MRPAFLAVAAAVLVTPAFAFAVGGARDPSFGTDGLVTNNTTGAFSLANALAVQADGNIVVAGAAGPNLSAALGTFPGGVLVVARLTPDGALDPSFGSGGIVTTSVGDQAGRGERVVVQPDGRIVVATGSADAGVRQISLVRYQPDGALDPSFGSGGIVSTPFPNVILARLLLQPDGKLIVVGGTNGQFLIARYADDGSVDGSFGSAGVTTTAVGSGNAFAYSAELEPDGRIVVVGGAPDSTGHDDFAVVRYDADGTLDASFGSGGIVLTPIETDDDAALDVARQPDGALVVCGRSKRGPNRFVLVRYDGLGNLDPTFGTAGVVVTYFPNPPTLAGDNVPLAIRVQADGKLVVGGWHGNLAGFASEVFSEVAIARYAADGSLDMSFGMGGKRLDQWDDLSLGLALELQPDGRIVVGGFTQAAGATNFRIAVARYLPECGDGSPDVGEECDGGTCCSSTCQLTIGASCDDGDAGTAGDTCIDGGVCHGGPVCSACETSDPIEGCVPAPRPACTLPAQPGAARLSLRDSASGDRLGWKWLKGGATSYFDFDSVLTTDDVTLCVFDTTPNVLVAALTPAGGVCGTKPCWKLTGSGVAYRNGAGTPDGVVNARLTAGAAGKAKILVSAKGGYLAVPALTALALPLRVQLVSEDGHCWEADFSAAGVKVNDGARFEGKSD